MSETLRELIALDRDYFVPAQVAEVLGMDAQAIRILGPVSYTHLFSSKRAICP